MRKYICICIFYYLWKLLIMKVCIYVYRTHMYKSECVLGNTRNIGTIFDYRRKQSINLLSHVFYASKFNIIFIFNIVFIIACTKVGRGFVQYISWLGVPARFFILSLAWSPGRTSASREVLAATLCVVPRSVMPSLTVEGGIEKGGSWSFVARLRLDAHVRIVNTRQDSSPAHQKT